MKALITNITGQDGAHRSQFLLEKGYEVAGLARRASTPSLERVVRLGVLDSTSLIEGDLGDQLSIINAIRTTGPARCTTSHLAAQSFAPESHKTPVQTGDFTALGVTRCLETIRAVDPEIRFYRASSSEMLGKMQAAPQSELTPLHPRSPYGVAEVYGHRITANYRESYSLYAVRGMLLNHESPLLGLEFL